MSGERPDVVDDDSHNADDEAAGETTSTSSRFWLTNDIAALVLDGGFVLLLGLAAAGWVDLRAIPLELRMQLIALTGIATAWLFGGGAVTAWQSIQGGES